MTGSTLVVIGVWLFHCLMNSVRGGCSRGPHFPEKELFVRVLGQMARFYDAKFLLCLLTTISPPILCYTCLFFRYVMQALKPLAAGRPYVVHTVAEMRRTRARHACGKVTECH